jgi:hypothetical protein
MADEAISIDPMIYRAVAVRHALKLLAVGIKPNRAYTLRRCLAIAGEITGKKYPVSRGKALIAAQDIKDVLDGK